MLEIVVSKFLAHEFKTSPDDEGSSKSPQSEVEKFDCETRRRQMTIRADAILKNQISQLVTYLVLVAQS